MQEEIWKDIPNYEGIYQASNLGRIKSLKRKVKIFYTKLNKEAFKTQKERILKPRKSKLGYLDVCLCVDNKTKLEFVHRLVALTFLEHSETNNTVNHINGCKSDNYVSNLEWLSLSDNQKHSYKTGLRKHWTQI